MSIQQRLLQREPLDPWTVREQLCLASAVCRSGDQNWMSVSRALRASGDPTRPQDWYQQKYCAAQYGALLESAETPKRKKRTSEGGVESPQDAILKRLAAERIAELQKMMQNYKSQYSVLKEEIEEARSPTTSEGRVRELLVGVETSRRQREREQQRHAQWLRDREERRRNVDKRRVSVTAAGALSPPASSPLLTSLLQNTSPGAGAASVAQMLLLPHPSTVVDPVSPSASAPTLSMLLEKGRESVCPAPPPGPPPPAPPSPASDAAVIEQIKSELQEIETNLRLGNIPSSTPSSLAPPPPPQHKPPPAPVEIDDIEIKAEDVYAFSDMDLEIQPVSTIHKTLQRAAEKAGADRKEDAAEGAATLDAPPDNGQPVDVKEEVVETAPAAEETPHETAESLARLVPQENATVDAEEPVAVELQTEAEETPAPKLEDAVDNDNVEPEVSVDDAVPEEPPVSEEEVNVTGVSEADISEMQEDSLTKDSCVDNIYAGVENAEEQTEEEVGSPPEEEESVKGEEEEETLVCEEKNETIPAEAEPPTSPPHKEEEAWPVSQSGGEEAGPTEEAEPASEGADGKRSEAEETHTETDDDTPMEVIREEEKGGRKRRDYSRRKTQQTQESRAGWGSESAAESAPESPAAAPRPSAVPDPDRDHRLWKKSVLLVYNRLCAHKYASLFLRPITDDLAPDYSLVVRRPMDLTTIKRNIDSGGIRTTAEFQRDVLLMLSNALFYNSSRHRVHQMAQEMHQEAVAQLGMLLQAQAHSGLDSHEPVSRRTQHGERRERDGKADRKRERRLSTASPPAKRLRSD